MDSFKFDLTTWSDTVVNGFNRAAPKLRTALLVLLCGFVIIKLLSWFSHLFLNLLRLPKGLRGILASLIDCLLWVFLIVSVLQSLGLDRIALIFSGSIAAAGLALAVGASNLTADILAGIFLAQDKDFNVDDEIIAGEKPTEGVIESMDMRRTRIRDNNGKLHVIPNSVIERKEWVVLSPRREKKLLRRKPPQRKVVHRPRPNA